MDIKRIVSDFLRDGVAAHKRRIAIRQGNREPDSSNCDHSNWNYNRQWCEDCGITLKELFSDQTSS